MLSRAELERVGQTITRGNVGHAETLYLQDMLLLTISRETADELVFKGGTALLKCYGLDRFSEALDFTARSQIQWVDLLEAMVRNLENYGASVAERSHEESVDTVTARFGIEGPLYTGDRRSLCFVRLQVNTRSTASRVRNRRYNPPFTDLPSFDLAVLDEAEILAEKVRALATRRQPRDLYDVYHLLQRSVSVDPALVEEKLEYYDLEYDPVAINERARALESSWESLEPLTYSSLPPFDAVMEVVAAMFDGQT